MARLPAGHLGDRPECLDRSAQERRATADGVEQRLGLGRRLARGQRDVDREKARPLGGRREESAATSFAVLTSDGSDRYGKSWTRTRTS